MKSFDLLFILFSFCQFGLGFIIGMFFAYRKMMKGKSQFMFDLEERVRDEIKRQLGKF